MVDLNNNAVSSGMSSLGATALSAGLGFGAQVGSGIFSSLFSANQAKLNRKFQERMYNKQVEDNIKFWNMQNDYNLPSAQLQRLRDAGLSSLLAYGDGGLSGNIAQSQVQSGKAPNGAQASSGMNAALDFANLALLQAQIKNLNADSAQKTASANNLGKQTENLDFDLSFKKDTSDINKYLLITQADLNKSMENLNIDKRREIDKGIEVANATIQNILDEISNRDFLTAAQVNDINERLAGFNKQLSHTIANLDSQTRLNYANAFVAQVTGNFYKRLYSDDYVKILQGSAGQEFLNAIKYGTQLDIENGLRGLEFISQPKPGEGYYQYNRFIKYGLSPALDVLKDAAIGAAGIYGVGKMSSGPKMFNTKVRSFQNIP